MHSHPTLSRAVLGGFVGTAAMTAMMYFVAPMMGLRMGAMAAIASLVGHVLYGSLLGMIATAPQARPLHA